MCLLSQCKSCNFPMDELTQDQLQYLNNLYQEYEQSLLVQNEILSHSSDEEMVQMTNGRGRRNGVADVMEEVDNDTLDRLKNLRDVTYRGDENLTPEEDERCRSKVSSRKRRNAVCAPSRPTGSEFALNMNECQSRNRRRNSMVTSNDNGYITEACRLRRRRNAVADILQTVQPGSLDNIRNIRHSSSSVELEEAVTSSLVGTDSATVASTRRRNGMANIFDNVDLELLNDLRNSCWSEDTR